MTRLALTSFAWIAIPLVTPLTACNYTGGERSKSGECPAGEICSPATPRGLHFIGEVLSGEVLSRLYGPAPTAIGGTQEIALQYDRGDGVQIALDLPYRADDDGGIGVEVEASSGSVVTIRGAGSRSNYLRIVDPDTDELYDRKELSGAAITAIHLVGTDFELLPTERPEIVWATGDQEIGVALVGEVQVGNASELRRLVDTSMQLSLPGSTRTSWDTLRVANGLAGVQTLGITAGDRPAATLPVEFVTGADTMKQIAGEPTLLPASSETLCFAAMNSGRYVYGLTWEYNVDGVPSTRDEDDQVRNCITVSAPAGSAGTTISVAVAAGGQQLNTTLVVDAAARLAGEVEPTTGGTLLRSTSTAGDRAAME